MSDNDRREPDPMALLDAVKEWLEGVHGVIAILTADGFTEEQARAITTHLMTQGGGK